MQTLRPRGPTSQHPSDLVAQFARVLGSSTSANTGAVLLNVEGIAGFPGKEGESSVGVESYGALGLLARPLPPDTVGGQARHTEVLCLRTADALVPIASRDVRLNQALPNLKPGDVALVGYGSNFVKLSPDGYVYVVTTSDGTPNGKLVQLQHRPDGFAYVAPWGKLTFDAGGFHVLHVSGARVDLGGIGGLPAPLGALGSYLAAAAALIKLQCAALTVGGAGDASDNAVRATPLEAVLLAVSAAAKAVAAAESAAAVAFSGLGSIPALSSAAAACGTASTAAGATIAALHALVAAIDLAVTPASPSSVRSRNLMVS